MLGDNSRKWRKVKTQYDSEEPRLTNTRANNKGRGKRKRGWELGKFWGLKANRHEIKQIRCGSPRMQTLICSFGDYASRMNFDFF